MPEPQILHDDYGDAITIEADGIAIAMLHGMTGPPAVLVTFYDTPSVLPEGQGWVRMRLSGERLAAFTEALDRHAASLAALASEGNDDE